MSELDPRPGDHAPPDAGVNGAQDAVWVTAADTPTADEGVPAEDGVLAGVGVTPDVAAEDGVLADVGVTPDVAAAEPAGSGGMASEVAETAEAPGGSGEVAGLGSDVSDESGGSAEVAGLPSDVSDESGGSAEPKSPVAAALAELDTLPDRELADHPDVYQRIHSELQSALSAIDDA